MADEIGMAAWHHLNCFTGDFTPILLEIPRIRWIGLAKEYVCPMSGVTMVRFKYHRNVGRG